MSNDVFILMSVDILHTKLKSVLPLSFLSVCFVVCISFYFFCLWLSCCALLCGVVIQVLVCVKRPTRQKTHKQQ